MNFFGHRELLQARSGKRRYAGKNARARDLSGLEQQDVTTH
ncbi:hypothetical protein ACTXGQ_08340 [Marinobacter sp. 1Y8]